MEIFWGRKWVETSFSVIQTSNLNKEPCLGTQSPATAHSQLKGRWSSSTNFSKFDDRELELKGKHTGIKHTCQVPVHTRPVAVTSCFHIFEDNMVNVHPSIGSPYQSLYSYSHQGISEMHYSSLKWGGPEQVGKCELQTVSRLI